MYAQAISDVRVEATAGGFGSYERLRGKITEALSSTPVEPLDQSDRPIGVAEFQPCRSSVDSCSASEV